MFVGMGILTVVFVCVCVRAEDGEIRGVNVRAQVRKLASALEGSKV